MSEHTTGQMTPAAWIAVTIAAMSLVLNMALFSRGTYYQGVVDRYNTMVEQDHTDVAVLKTDMSTMKTDIRDIKLALGIAVKSHEGVGP